MSHLTRYLQQQLNAQIASARKNLTAHGPRIAQAETLANKLQSQAVEALAAGQIDGHHVLIWVAVTATYQTISKALVRLNLIERERFVTSLDCEIHVEGFDVPIYLTAPRRARTRFEQALDEAIADRHGKQAIA